MGMMQHLVGRVVLTDGPVMLVHVRAAKYLPSHAHHHTLTHTYWLTFISRAGPVLPVVPHSLQEVKEYVYAHDLHVEGEVWRGRL